MTELQKIHQPQKLSAIPPPRPRGSQNRDFRVRRRQNSNASRRLAKVNRLPLVRQRAFLGEEEMHRSGGS